MLKSFASFLEKLSNPDAGERLGDDDRRIAAAALLVHAMAVDGMITEGESKRLRELLTAHYDLAPDDLNRLLIEAERRERDAIDIYRFTSVLRDRLSIDEKREIIAMMWRLVYADGHLEAQEDNLVWRTAELLAVPARDRMQLKQIVRAETEAE